MCTLATEETSRWLMVDPWEAFQSYQRTAVVLDHFDYEINTVLGGVQMPSGERRHIRVVLLAGSDLISTMSEPGVWSENDVSLTAFQVHRRHSHSPLAGSYPWKVRHVHHRTRRLGHGSSDGGPRSLASQHFPCASAHTERCVLNQSSLVHPSWTFRALPSSGSRCRLHRTARSIYRRRVYPRKER